MCVSVWIFKEQEKAEKVSKRESTLKEVESSTKDLRELLEQHAITGTILELSDDAMVCGKNIQKIIQLWFLSVFLSFYYPLLGTNSIIITILTSIYIVPFKRPKNT